MVRAGPGAICACARGHFIWQVDCHLLSLTSPKHQCILVNSCTLEERREKWQPGSLWSRNTASRGAFHQTTPPHTLSPRRDASDQRTTLPSSVPQSAASRFPWEGRLLVGEERGGLLVLDDSGLRLRRHRAGDGDVGSTPATARKSISKQTHHPSVEH